MLIDEEVYLEHFGVKGMKWGRRKPRDEEARRRIFGGRKERKAEKKAIRKEYSKKYFDTVEAEEKKRGVERLVNEADALAKKYGFYDDTTIKLNSKEAEAARTKSFALRDEAFNQKVEASIVAGKTASKAMVNDYGAKKLTDLKLDRYVRNATNDPPNLFEMLKL